MIDTATLSSLTGLSGLTATPRGTGVQNGCHWQTGALGVAYDVLPQVLPTDQMIAQIKASAAGDGTNAAIQTVDLGGGHSIVEVTASGVPFASASLLLGDRMVAIVVTLNANKDPAPVGLAVAKAFNAVASALPPAPKL